MYKEISRFIIYRDMSGDSILSELGKIFEDFDSKSDTEEHLRTRIYVQVRRLLEVATKYGFDNNLWHNYLTFFIITDENMQTSIEGVFAVGDIRTTPLRQVITAAADGTIGAVNAIKYIEHKLAVELK